MKIILWLIAFLMATTGFTAGVWWLGVIGILAIIALWVDADESPD